MRNENRYHLNPVAPADRKSYRDDLVKWLANFDGQWHFAITLTSNDSERSFDRMKELLLMWEARVNKKFVGRRWYKPRKAKQRMRIFAVLEKQRTNPHWHLIVRFERCLNMQDAFSLAVDQIWQELLPSGDAMVKLITDAEGWTGYILKEFENGNPPWEILPRSMPDKEWERPFKPKPKRKKGRCKGRRFRKRK